MTETTKTPDVDDLPLVTLGGGARRQRSEPEPEPTLEESPAGEADQPPDEKPEVFQPGPDEGALGALRQGPTPVNIRNFSIKCGYCGEYQTIITFRRIDEDWNEYTYVCDSDLCRQETDRSKTLLEIPSDLDEYARRDPGWHGGKKHAGADG